MWNDFFFTVILKNRRKWCVLVLRYLRWCSGSRRLGNREDTGRSKIQPCWSSGLDDDTGPARTHPRLEKRKEILAILHKN